MESCGDIRGDVKAGTSVYIVKEQISLGITVE